MKSPAIAAVFLIISIFTGVFVSCGKNGNPPSPEEIAKVVGQAIENGLREAEADMGNGTPTFKLAESKGNSFTYKGEVPFYSGSSSFEREITATYNGKTVVYVFDDDTDGIKNTINWSKTDEGRNTALPRNAVLRPLSSREVAGIVNENMRERGLRRTWSQSNLKFVSDEFTGDVFTYKEYSFGGGGYRDYFTIRYNGQTVEYFYNQETPIEIYTVELEPDESRYIIPPNGTAVIVLQYPEYISDIPQYFIHYKLSNNEVKFLEKVANTKDLGNNLYIYDSFNQSVMDVIKTVNDSARLDEEVAVTANFTFSFSAGQLLGVMEILLDGFNVDALPEKIYPVTDRNAEARLQKDINTSKAFGILMSAAAMEYINLAQLGDTERTRRIQRLNNGLSSGNKSLFKKVFGAEAKNLALKGFPE